MVHLGNNDPEGPEPSWLIEYHEKWDVRLDEEHRANQGHVYQIKIDGEWQENWFRTHEEAWMYIAGYREAMIKYGQ